MMWVTESCDRPAPLHAFALPAPSPTGTRSSTLLATRMSFRVVSPGVTPVGEELRKRGAHYT